MSQVYFIFSPDDPRSLVKIGYTKGDVEGRIAQLQIGCPFRLQLILALDGGGLLERTLHHRFRKSRCHGEWFYPTEEIRAFIIDALGQPFLRSVAETLSDPSERSWQASVLGWTDDEVRDGLLRLQAG